jgi:hypothetical protein
LDLSYGASKLDRRVRDVETLLNAWLEGEKDWGQLYLEYQPFTPGDRLYLEDLAVTMLINSRVAGQAAINVCRNADAVDLASLPEKALEETTEGERALVASVIGTMTSWPWVGASLATKTLHKKRPALIPVLDNQAIFGAYMNPLWPEKPALAETIKAPARIKEALDCIATDLTRAENAATWTALEQLQPTRTRIELFDMIWWGYFREVQPVARMAGS